MAGQNLTAPKKPRATFHSTVAKEMQLQLQIMFTLNIYQAHPERCIRAGYFILMPAPLLCYDEMKLNPICRSLLNSPCIYINAIVPTNISTCTTCRECVYMNTVHTEKLCLSFFEKWMSKIRFTYSH